MNFDTLKKLVDMLFDKIEARLANRPLLLMAAHALRVVAEGLIADLLREADAARLFSN